MNQPAAKIRQQAPRLTLSDAPPTGSPLRFAASLLEGFHVNGFVAALVGSLLYSLCGLVIDAAMERLFVRR